MSLSDIVAAVRWMLQCELNIARERKLNSVETALDLGIAGTSFRFPKDFVSEDSKLLPLNYFGNGFIAELAQYPESETEQQRSCSLLNILVEAAQAIRKSILAKRSDSLIASELVRVYEGRGNPETNPLFVALVSSLHKMPSDKIDFQGGPPVYNYVPPVYPFYSGRGTLSALGGGDGMILNILVLTRDLKNAINSDVLRELCPGARFVSQMTALQFRECCLVSRV